MAGDSDPAVRLIVAQRLPPAQLALLIDDPDWRIRYEVAQRIDLSRLGPLLDDEDAAVREAAHGRGENRVA
jgi:leucine rich repeat (LRR) protein